MHHANVPKSILENDINELRKEIRDTVDHMLQSEDSFHQAIGDKVESDLISRIRDFNACLARHNIGRYVRDEPSPPEPIEVSNSSGYTQEAIGHALGRS